MKVRMTLIASGEMQIAGLWIGQHGGQNSSVWQTAIESLVRWLVRMTAMICGSAGQWLRVCAEKAVESYGGFLGDGVEKRELGFVNMLF